MDSETNSEISTNGIKKSKNAVPNGSVKGIVDKGAKGGKSPTKSSNSKVTENGTEQLKSTLSFQVKSETGKSADTKTGSGTSSVSKDSKDTTGSTVENKSAKEENTDKKSAGGKSIKLSSFAAPTKSSKAKVAGKTPESQKSTTSSEKSTQDSSKDTSEKRSSLTKKKGSFDSSEKLSTTEQEKQKPKIPVKSDLVKDKYSADLGKPKPKVSEKPELDKTKQVSKSTTDTESKPELNSKDTEKNLESKSKFGLKPFKKSDKKRIIGSEKSTLEEQDLCYLNFDFQGDYNMAQAQIDPATAPKEGTEYIYVSDNKLKYINTNYKKVGAKMYDYKCDIKLKVADQNFKAHREVLSEASDYFSAMFRHNMKEKEQDVIELKEICPKGFAAILDYFYHGHVTIDPDNIEDVIEAARFFHNDWLLEICCDFLVRHLSLENYTSVLQLTDKYYLGDLRWDIFVFLGQNLADLEQQEKFYQNLPMELILQFLMENVYVEASEYFILQLILKWVKEDPEKRQEHLLSLLRQVRFPVMEAEELESLPEEVMKIPEMKQLVEDAKDYVYNVMGQCLKVGELYQPRGSRSVLTVLSFSDECNVVAYRDPSKEGLFVEQLGPTGLETADYHAMSQTSIGNFLYAAGGYDDAYSSIARVFRYDPKYREWTEVAPMNQPRVSFAVCSSDTKMFVVGGVNHQHTDEGEQETLLSEVEVFDPQENNWTALCQLPVKCFDQAATFWDNCLYVTGGISDDPNDPVPLDNTWCLDLDSNDSWVPKHSMTSQRQGHSMTALNGKLYVVGGYTNFGDLMTFRDSLENEVFDIETGQWTKLAPTPDQYGHLYRHVGLIDHRIHVLGGSTPCAKLFIYDTDTDTWEEKEEIGPSVQKLAVLNVAYPHS